MILDFHAHILPGVDHGSDSLETSLRQLSLAKKSGISAIVATSHFYPQSRSAHTFVERRDSAYGLLIEKASDIDMRILLGAEVLLCNSLENLPNIGDLCIRGTKMLLLELPFADFQVGYCKSVFNLLSDGYEVVMAHAERYDPSWIEETLEAGAKLQLNAKALSRFSRKRYMKWLENGNVVAIGSDIHGADAKAYKRFLAAARFTSRFDSITEFTDKILKQVK